MSKAVLIPPLGARWVKPDTSKPKFARRIWRHGGTRSLSLPVELCRRLEIEIGDIVLLSAEGDALMVRVARTDSLLDREEKPCD